MTTFKPWLKLKSWTFSEWKTVNSVRDSNNFNEFKQINIFNQPTWYVHILIKTPNDLINVLKDIYTYHLYYNSYSEKLEQLELYKTSLYNIENKIPTYPKAYNIPKPNSLLESIKIKFNILIWKQQVCNLMQEHIIKEIHYIENIYLKERERVTKIYWEDLILDYNNYISLDEAQIYFWSRSWEKNFSWKNEFLKEFIAYPVKLNCKLEPIVQNPNMLDVNFKRQASTYILHESKLFWLIQKTSVIDVKETEKVSFENAEVLSKSYRINFYKIFWYPKIQYYRKHLIKPTDPDIYTPWEYFKHVRKMTDKYNELNTKKSKNEDIKKNNIQIIT